MSQENERPLESQPPPFKEYNYRIIITLLFSVASFINGVCWVVVTPIATFIEKGYGISSQVVALIPMSYLVLYVLVNFPSNWVIDVKGIKKGVMIGATLTCLGCLIRCLTRVSFYFVIVGQLFCATAQPFLINAPMKIATRWYLPKHVCGNHNSAIFVNGDHVSYQYHWDSNWVRDSTSFC
jgi:FLVCR family feline leukemia virus subgroup C receptor-related protein